MIKGLIQYLEEIKVSKAVLWCYLIWYVVTVYFYFDASPKIWISSLGISAVIGTGLIFSISTNGIKHDYWQIFRLYLMPFCVSSFSALIKDQGFIIVVSPNAQETALAALCCLLFLSAVWVVKRLKK